MKHFKITAAAAAGMIAVFAAGPAMADHTPEGSAISVPQPPEGQGQVVFFRPSAMGFAMGCTVKEGETKVSSLGNGKYFILVSEPGKRTFAVSSKSKDALTLLVESDETQFVRCRMKMGLFGGRPDLSPSTGSEFADKSEKLKVVDDEDMGEGALRSADLAVAD